VDSAEGARVLLEGQADTAERAAAAATGRDATGSDLPALLRNPSTAGGAAT
jgi:hypothetical protein